MEYKQKKENAIDKIYKVLEEDKFTYVDAVDVAATTLAGAIYGAMLSHGKEVNDENIKEGVALTSVYIEDLIRAAKNS